VAIEPIERRLRWVVGMRFWVVAVRVRVHIFPMAVRVGMD
jgi:hypothetical protein